MVQSGVADRLKAARAKAGLSAEVVGAHVGLGANWYWDLEAYDSELTSNVSLAHLSVLCDVLGTSPQDLILGAGSPPVGTISFTELGTALNERMRQLGLTADELGQQVGWNVKDVVVDSEELWNFTLDGVRDLCRATDLDWKGILVAIEVPRTGLRKGTA